jgi:uncharacterized membrane protein YccF (DUF307 family)
MLIIIIILVQVGYYLTTSFVTNIIIKQLKVVTPPKKTGYYQVTTPLLPFGLTTMKNAIKDYTLMHYKKIVGSRVCG